jgi:hypothetical protein
VLSRLYNTPRQMTVEVRHFGSVMRLLLPLLDRVLESKMKYREDMAFEIAKIEGGGAVTAAENDGIYMEKVPPGYQEIASTGVENIVEEDEEDDDDVVIVDVMGDDGGDFEDGAMFYGNTVQNSRIDGLKRLKMIRNETKQTAVRNWHISISHDADEEVQAKINKKPTSRLERNMARGNPMQHRINKARVKTKNCGLTLEAVHYLLSKGVLKPYTARKLNQEGRLASSVAAVVVGDGDGDNVKCEISADGMNGEVSLPPYLSSDSLRALPALCTLFDTQRLHQIACIHCTEMDICDVLECAAIYIVENETFSFVFDVSAIVESDSHFDGVEREPQVNQYSMLTSDWEYIPTLISEYDMPVYLCEVCDENKVDINTIIVSNDNGQVGVDDDIVEVQVEKSNAEGHVGGDAVDNEDDYGDDLYAEVDTSLAIEQHVDNEDDYGDDLYAEVDTSLAIDQTEDSGKISSSTLPPPQTPVTTTPQTQPVETTAQANTISPTPPPHLVKIPATPQSQPSVTTDPTSLQPVSIAKKMTKEEFVHQSNISSEHVDYLIEHKLIPIAYVMKTKLRIVAESVKDVIDALIGGSAPRLIALSSISNVDIENVTNCNKNIININNVAYLFREQSLEQTATDFQMSVEDVQFLIKQDSDLKLPTGDSGAAAQEEGQAEPMAVQQVDYLRLNQAINCRLIALSILAESQAISIEEIIDFIKDEKLDIRVIKVGSTAYAFADEQYSKLLEHF